MAVAGTLEIEVILDGKKARIGLDKLKKRMGLFEKSAKSTNKIFGKLAKFATVGFLAKMAIDAAKFGRSMSLIADRTGIATEKLIGMRTAFSAVGGKAGEVDRLLGSISKGLAGLSYGKGEFASKLAAMGISAWGANGKTKSADVVMGDIADWTKNQLSMGRSKEEVASYLEDAFGISYQMFQRLKLGRQGMAQSDAALNKKTGTVSERQVHNLDSLQKSISLLTTTFTSLKNQIAGDIAPIIQFVSDLLQYVVREFQDIWGDLSKTYRDLVGDGEAVNDLFKALKFVLKWVVIEPIKGFMEYIKVILVGVKKFGELLAWIVDKFSWMFSSEKEKQAKRDRELATKALQMPFASHKERLAWMATQSDYYMDMYEKAYGEKPFIITVPNADGTVPQQAKMVSPEELPMLPEDVEELEPLDPDNLPEGVEIGEVEEEEYEQPKLPPPGSLIYPERTPDITVSNHTEITPQPDGTYQAETTTSVEGGGLNFQQQSLQTVTGV